MPLTLFHSSKSIRLLALLGLLLPLALQAEDQRVLMLHSTNDEAEQIFVQAFTDSLQSLQTRADFRTLNLARSQSDASRLETVNTFQPKLVLCIGEAAVRFSKNLPPELPKLAAMADVDENSYPFCGLRRTVAPADGLAQVRAMMPEMKTVGIMWHEEKNAHQIKRLRQEGERLGLRVVALQVDTGRAIPDALRTLLPQIDALWAVSDPIIYRGATRQTILTACFRAKVPLLGISQDWVRMGGLLNLETDAAETGKQAAQMASDLLDNKACPSPAWRSPKNPSYSLNLRTLKYMELTLPDQVIASAVVVFQ